MDCDRVKQIIEASGLSNRELARITGLAPQTINSLVVDSDCKISTLEKVADALGVSLLYLLGDEEVKVEVRGGKNIFLNANRSKNVMNNKEETTGDIQEDNQYSNDRADEKYAEHVFVYTDDYSTLYKIYLSPDHDYLINESSWYDNKYLKQ